MRLDMMMMRMILLLNRYGYISLLSLNSCSLLVGALVLVSPLHFCIRLVDPTALLFFPSVRGVGFPFSLSSSFESYPFLFSLVLIHSFRYDGLTYALQDRDDEVHGRS